jgi:hypothetical protein
MIASCPAVKLVKPKCFFSSSSRSWVAFTTPPAGATVQPAASSAALAPLCGAVVLLNHLAPPRAPPLLPHALVPVTCGHNREVQDG